MIILLGYMGSGKSTVGKALAKKLGIEHIDLDDYIEAQENALISDIFSKKGEVYFRRKETEYLNTLLGERPDIVLSLGGGTPCFGKNAESIRQKARHTFYLRGTIPTLSKRLAKERSQRPLISHLLCNASLIEFLGKHLFERDTFYREASHEAISIDDKTVLQLTEEILGHLQTK